MISCFVFKLHLVLSITLFITDSQVCMRHIFSAARAPSSSSFDYYMDKVKLLKPASHASMMKNPPTLWANYTCRDNVIWDQVTTNMSEAANNVIRDEVNAWYNSCVFRQHFLETRMENYEQLWDR